MQSKSPIIVVEDTARGPISTTDDILSQLSMLCYSPNLKGIDLDQFMQMTDEKDFKQYGIKKTKHCRELSACADSIRRTSLSSASSSSSEEEENDYPARSEIIPLSKLRYYYENFAKQIGSTQKWPNSHVKELSTPHSSRPSLRRSSAPLASTLPKYQDLICSERKRSHSEDIRLTTSTVAKTKNEIELLPNYTCTVQKIGQASVKIEYTSSGKRPLRRKWRRIQMELSGTLLKLFEIKSNNQMGVQKYPILTAFSPQPTVRKALYMSLSLANASVSVATDYTKKQNVFRLAIDQGPTLLIHVQTNAELSSWIEKITAGYNICEDLEHRRMPNFFTSLVQTWDSEISRDTIDLFERFASEERRRRESEPDALI